MNALASEYLGSGYDVCGEYADGASIKKRIFDLSLVPEKDLRHIPNTRANFFAVQGKSYEEYQSSLSAKVNLSGGYNLFSGSVKSSFSKTDLSIAESGFVSIKLFMQYETWKLQATAQEYMYPDVIHDFNTQEDGKLLIEQYGAAVVMGMDIGGQWSDNYSVSKLDENSTSHVAVSMEAAYGDFASGRGSTEISEARKRLKCIATRRVNTVGGDPRFAPEELNDWQASVKENLAFMNFSDDGLIWIWDLFPEQKDKLEKGFHEYVNEKELAIEAQGLIQCKIVEGLKYSSDKGSGADRDLDLYKPVTSDSSYKYVGVNGEDNKTLVVKELAPNYGALQEPVSWHCIWKHRDSKHKKDYSCWLPVAPPDYVALGVYCRFHSKNEHPPSKHEANGFVVVHKSFVKRTGFEMIRIPTPTVSGVTSIPHYFDKVWSDKGSGAKHHLKLGRLPHHALWPSKTTDPKAGILPTKYTIKDEYMVK